MERSYIFISWGKLFRWLLGLPFIICGMVMMGIGMLFLAPGTAVLNFGMWIGDGEKRPGLPGQVRKHLAKKRRNERGV